eukprot:12894161-Prorocentrum_lima.AAC.1
MNIPPAVQAQAIEQCGFGTPGDVTTPSEAVAPISTDPVASGFATGAGETGEAVSLPVASPQVPGG